MSQTDDSWNPYAKLEFLKVVVHLVFSLKVSEMRKVVNVEISGPEEELNQIEDLKVTVLSRTDISQEEINTKVETIDNAVTSLKSKLPKLRKKFSDTMTFVSRAKWFEYGKKSNKLFLNFIKSRQNQKLINKIQNDEKVFVGQDQVSKGITDFYRELYLSQPTEQNNEDNFNENCPKLSEEQAKFLDNDLSLKELQEALSSCKDSSPGPDGIPYI